MMLQDLFLLLLLGYSLLFRLTLFGDVFWYIYTVCSFLIHRSPIFLVHSECVRRGGGEIDRRGGGGKKG